MSITPRSVKQIAGATGADWNLSTHQHGVSANSPVLDLRTVELISTPGIYNINRPDVHYCIGVSGVELTNASVGSVELNPNTRDFAMTSTLLTDGNFESLHGADVTLRAVTIHGGGINVVGGKVNIVDKCVIDNPTGTLGISLIDVDESHVVESRVTVSREAPFAIEVSSDTFASIQRNTALGGGMDPVRGIGDRVFVSGNRTPMVPLPANFGPR